MNVSKGFALTGIAGKLKTNLIFFNLVSSIQRLKKFPLSLSPHKGWHIISQAMQTYFSKYS